jgi:hypothetical protein
MLLGLFALCKGIGWCAFHVAVACIPSPISQCTHTTNNNNKKNAPFSLSLSLFFALFSSLFLFYVFLKKKGKKKGVHEKFIICVL